MNTAEDAFGMAVNGPEKVDPWGAVAAIATDFCRGRGGRTVLSAAELPDGAARLFDDADRREHRHGGHCLDAGRCPFVNPLARRIGLVATLVLAAVISAASLIGFYIFPSIGALVPASHQLSRRDNRLLHPARVLDQCRGSRKAARLRAGHLWQRAFARALRRGLLCWRFWAPRGPCPSSLASPSSWCPRCPRSWRMAASREPTPSEIAVGAALHLACAAGDGCGLHFRRGRTGGTRAVPGLRRTQRL